METFDDLIDTTTFGTVRQHLRAAPSPVPAVILVQHRDTLPQVGSALAVEAGVCPALRRRQWARWFASGEVRVAGPTPATGQAADLDAIPDAARCDVLYVPPVYLVSLRGRKLPPQASGRP